MKGKKKSTNKTASKASKSRPVHKKKLKKTKQSSIKNQNLLSNALRDIERQLELLKGQKLDTEKQMRGLSQGISNTQSQEMALKEKVQKLIAK